MLRLKRSLGGSGSRWQRAGTLLDERQQPGTPAATPQRLWPLPTALIATAENTGRPVQLESCKAAVFWGIATAQHSQQASTKLILALFACGCSCFNHRGHAFEVQH
jgi:hypothetical protein